MHDILGRGWSFPVRRDRLSGRVALVDGEEEIRQAIIMILSTVKGERVMRPEFGCQLHELVFAPSNSATIGLAVYYIEQALGMWEPRIRLLDVRVELAQRSGDQLFLITLSYELKATLDQRTLVYPFYRLPSE
jgi:hypothetical protein